MQLQGSTTPALLAMGRAVARLRSRWDDQHLLVDVLDLLPDAYLRTTVDGTIVDGNENALQLLSAPSVDALIGRVMRELVAPWDRARHDEIADSARGLVATAEMLALRPEGESPFRVSVAAVGGTTGETHWLLRTIDSSRHDDLPHPAELGRRAETIEHMPAAAYVTLADPGFTPEYLSPGLSELVGASPHEWIAAPHAWVSAINAEDRFRVHAARLRARGAGVFECTYRIRKRDGSTVLVLDRAHRGEVAGGPRWFGVLVDVTHVDDLADVAGTLYDDVRQRAERAEALAAAKHAALEIFAHDLRSPLTAAVRVLELMRKGTRHMDERLVDDLQGALQHSLDRVTSLLAEIQELQSLDTRSREQWQLVDLGQLAHDVAETFDDSRITVEAPSLLVEAVPGLLRRAVGNVVDNALKHSGEDGRVKIQVVDGGDAHVVITDNGPGVPDELREHLFDPFVRGSGLTGGLGLGLALVRRVCEMHGGQATVRNLPTGGARFELSLPAITTGTGEPVSTKG